MALARMSSSWRARWRYGGAHKIEVRSGAQSARARYSDNADKPAARIKGNRERAASAGTYARASVTSRPRCHALFAQRLSAARCCCRPARACYAMCRQITLRAGAAAAPRHGRRYTPPARAISKTFRARARQRLKATARAARAARAVALYHATRCATTSMRYGARLWRGKASTAMRRAPASAKRRRCRGSRR